MRSSEERKLPAGWAWASLGDLVRVIRGVTYKKEDAQDAPSEDCVPILRATNIKTQLTFDDLVFVPRRYISEDQYLRDGDIVLAGSSGSKKVVGKAAPLHFSWQGSFGAFCFALRPYSIATARYLALFLQSNEYRHKISQQSAGVNINNIRAIDLEMVPVPLAPVAEQARIVTEVEAHLTRLDSAVETLKRVQANLKRYRAAVLKSACQGDLVPTEAELSRAEVRKYETATQLMESILASRGRDWEHRARRKAYLPAAVPAASVAPTLPEGWAIASLEQITSSVRPICYGILMPKENFLHGVPYVRVVDIKGDTINLGAIRHTSPSIAAKYSRSSLVPGDVLISIRGSYGRVARVPPELDRGNITQDTARLDICAELNATYIMHYLRSPLAQTFFRRVARGVAVKGVNIGDLKQTPILVPPIAEQSRIVAELERRLSIADKIEATFTDLLRRADHLRQSILKSAFEGAIVTQDPNDEHASILLERICQARAAEDETRPRRRGRKPVENIVAPRRRRAAR